MEGRLHIVSLPFAMSRFIADAALAALCLAASSSTGNATPLYADLPFAEVFPSRQPLAGLWEPSTLPSNWTALPCVTPLGSPLVPVTLGVGPLALFPCSNPPSMQALAVAGSARVLSAPFLTDASSTTLFASCTTGGAPGSTFMMATPTGVNAISCDMSMLACKVVGALVSGVNWEVQTAYSHPFTYKNGTSVDRLWLSSPDYGITAYDVSNCAAATQVFSSPAVQASAFAFSPKLQQLAYGNDTGLVLMNASSLVQIRFEWVANIAQGWGGPVDDVITALLYSPTGWLYIANPTCLNIAFPNKTFIRVDGLGGLPVANLTSLALDTRYDSLLPPRSSPRIWLGSTQGLILFDPEASSWWGGDAPTTTTTAVLGPDGASQAGTGTPRSGTGPVQLPQEPRWRYFNGARYFPCDTKDSFSGSSVSGGGILPIGNTTYVLGPSGVTALDVVTWTLADKAAWMEAQLGIFDLYGQGLVGDCGLTSFGRYPCLPSPNDNNGLWTSLVVAAESYRYAVTGDADAKATATHYLLGMKTLNDVTGIHGLFARSATPPGEPCPTSWPWHNSTAMPGYCFKGDASSDELVGHAMAYPLYAMLVDNVTHASGGQSVAVDLLLNITTYIIHNNFTLVDVTGFPTTWGRWNPNQLNFNRSWSDDRGIDSVEILGLFNAALSFVASNSNDFTTITAAYQYLAVQEDYLTNMVNTRINNPCDINFSDDEMTFFMYLVMFATCSGQTDATFLQYASASLERSWATGVQAQRASVYSAMYLAATTVYPTCDSTSPQVPSTPATLAAAVDVLWSLRTWSSDLIDWPVANAQRLDIFINPDMDRFGGTNDQSLSVLPQYERVQGRWNANPFEFTGGSGGSMSDPGVWLYPYWLSRYLGII